MTGAIHQLLSVFDETDAQGHMALLLRDIFSRWGYRSEIFAGIRRPQLRGCNDIITFIFLTLFAERLSQVHGVLLLHRQDIPELVGQRVFLEMLSLFYPRLIPVYGVLLAVKVLLQHLVIVL